MGICIFSLLVKVWPQSEMVGCEQNGYGIQQSRLLVIIIVIQ